MWWRGMQKGWNLIYVYVWTSVFGVFSQSINILDPKKSGKYKHFWRPS